MAFWSRVTGLIAGGAVARAAADGATPVLEPVRQHAWSRNKLRVLDPAAAAQLVAQSIIDETVAEDEAGRSGFGANRLHALVKLTQTAPDLAELLELWRRGKIDEELVDYGLAKAQLDPQFWKPLKELFVGRLDPAIIATAVQRGIMKDPGILPVGPPTETGKVPKFPVSPLDTLDEARAHGIDLDRLFVETAIVGLPLSLQEAASAYFRGIIELADFKRAVSEGNTRNEWGDAALAQARQILTAGEYAELQLRGYLTADERRAQTAKHGMSEANSDLLYDVLGRGLNLHAAFVAERRGGVFEGPTADIPDWAMFQLQRGNLRPEVYNLAWAGRHSYPSAFVIRALLTGGALSRADGEDLFLKIGWPSALAKQVADFYGKASTTPADPHVTKAANQLWTATHSSYVKDRTDDTTAETKLAAIGVEASAIPQVLALWQEERELQRAGLSAAQIKKAYSEGTFAQPEAVARLVELGWSTADATVYLGE